MLFGCVFSFVYLHFVRLIFLSNAVSLLGLFSAKEFLVKLPCTDLHTLLTVYGFATVGEGSMY